LGLLYQFIESTLVFQTQHIMQLKPLSRSAIAKFSALSILTGMLVLSGTSIASAGPDSNNRTFPLPTESKDVAIDSYTDHFFYAANPELNKRKLGTDETTYIQEWQSIRAAIRPLVKTDREVCGMAGRSQPGEAPYWEFLFTLQNQSSYDYLTDAIFYHRNPQMAGKKLRPGTALANDWSAIRRKMFIYTCGT
jgi:hypothetical protein